MELDPDHYNAIALSDDEKKQLMSEILGVEIDCLQKRLEPVEQVPFLYNLRKLLMNEFIESWKP